VECPNADLVYGKQDRVYPMKISVFPQPSAGGVEVIVIMSAHGEKLGDWSRPTGSRLHRCGSRCDSTPASHGIRQRTPCGMLVSGAEEKLSVNWQYPPWRQHDERRRT
jgi:hypothetical protein